MQAVVRFWVSLLSLLVSVAAVGYLSETTQRPGTGSQKP